MHRLDIYSIMVLTYEQRVELLAKARQAKKDKKLAKEPSTIKQEEELEPSSSSVTEKPKKTRSKSVVVPKERTLDIKEPEKLPDFVDSEPEVEEQIIYKPKEKKKKKIIRKVIMEASSSDEEVEEVVEYVKAPKKTKELKIPPTPNVKQNVVTQSPFFNF